MNSKYLFKMFVMAVISVILGGFLASMASSMHAPLPLSAEALWGVTSAGLFLGMAFKHKLPAHMGVVSHGLEPEVWLNVVVDKVFPDNEFVMKSTDDGDFVLGGVVCHIPQAGGLPTVVKNRSSFPASATRRTDSDLTYALDEYTTDPTHITLTEAQALSYDKVASVWASHIEQLQNSVYEDLAYYWAAINAGQILRTTGSDSAAALSDSATGTRKMFTPDDLKRAQTLMNKQNMPKEGRVALIPSDLLGELQADPDFKKRDVAREVDYVNGKVARLYGFDIYERGTNTIFTSASTPVKRAPGAAPATTDNQSVLCWHPSAVSRSVGIIKPFERDNDPLYFGDIKSALMRAGGRQRRADFKGIVSIVQAVGV